MREVFAAYYFGVSGAMSAFTIAFQVPNLVRSLFADAAIQAAFVPVFTEQLEAREQAGGLPARLDPDLPGHARPRPRSPRCSSSSRRVLMPLFVGSNVPQGLTVTLSQVLFPILVLLGTTGMVVGILNSYDRFGAFAISPFFWNVAIIGVLVGMAPLFHGDDKIYAYAIGVLVGTVIQLAIPTWDLRNTPFRLMRVFDWRSLEVRRVLVLMLPVTLSLGLINFNLLINSIFGSLGLRRSAGGDRQGVPDLHAAAGDLLGGGHDRAVPDPGAARRPPRVRRPAERRWRTGCGRSCSCWSRRPPRSWCCRCR